MLNVGVIGLGMMGQTHLDIYGSRDDVRIVGIADRDEDRLHGKAKAGGNIEGQAKGGVDLSQARKYTSAEELIADDEVQLVDVCLPTPLHRQIGETVLAAGKHLMMEKPLARTAADAKALADRASSADVLSMPGMCMRFWPGWPWLKEAIDDERYGKLLSLHLRRVTSNPGGSFYTNGQASGGAIVDLHIHDADFVQWCLGMPQSVNSVGYTGITSAIDHVVTQYHYANGPTVTAEGGWAMAEGFGFEMQYTANFERATAHFDINAPSWLKVVEPGGKWQDVDLPAGMGYEHEISYLIDCIDQGRKPETVTFADAAESIRLVEAEARSVETGERVHL
jgi:predicted dehydrogenase